MKKNHSFVQSAPVIKFARGKKQLFRWSVAVAAVLFTAMAAQSLQASDPIGVYAVVDKVVFAPKTDSPETVQVWGVFALAEGRGETYSAPKRGYLFFKVDPEKPDVTRKEWNDLKEVAGSRQCVGFGNRYPKQKPTVRASDDKPKEPDQYALGSGIRKMRDAEYAPVKALLSAAAGKAAKPAEKKQ
jgi:hypothetical protein